jgi:acyl carrier protein phosphodiesterase
MNYLAHLYFSDPEPMAWAGSLMGDFLKGPLPADVDPQLLKHLRLHRKIDSFAQDSASFQASCRRLDSRYRFGRGILVDVFYDHFLACHWPEFSERTLEDFSHEVYQALNDCRQLLPPGLQNLLPRMVRDNWLVSYRQPEVVGNVLNALERRLKHRLPLGRGSEDLQRHRAELQSDFKAFMAEAEVFVGRWKAGH